MKLGINFLLWTGHVDEQYYPLFDKLKSVGYDGVEIPLCFGELDHYKKLGQVIKDAGLEVTCTSNGSAEQNLISDDAAIRQAGLDHIKWGVDRANALGGTVLGGPIHCAPATFTGAGPSELEFERAAEALKKAAAYGADAGVLIAPEILNRFECYLTNNVKQAKYLSELVDHSNYGIHYDTHHANIEESDIVAALKNGGKHIRHVHFSESHRGTLGTGQANFIDTVKGLEAIGYDEWVTLEAFTTKVDGLKQAVHMWQEQESDEALCYQKSLEFLKKFY